jgi:hypothetical protein
VPPAREVQGQAGGGALPRPWGTGATAVPLSESFRPPRRGRSNERVVAPSHGDLPMANTVSAVQVGQTVPDFKFATFDAKSGKFGEFDLAAQKAAGKWTILFFYPADFTFV